MTRATKKQINIKMPEPLIEALKNRAESEGKTFTDVVTRLCERGLGIESDSHKTITPIIEPVQLNERIADQLASQLAPLQGRVIALEESLGKLWV